MPQIAALDETSSATLWPGMSEKGWVDKFKTPEPTEALRRSFDNLVFDEYAPHAQRWRRFSQFIAFHDCAGELTLSKLPHHPFVQSAKHNSLSGGILRKFAPLEAECDVTPYVKQLFDLLEIDPSRRFHLDVHQYRVYGKPGLAGTSVPEGAHRDGMQCVAIVVVERKGITPESAEFSLIDPETKQPFLTTVVEAGEGIILDDTKMLHDAKPIIASGSETGYRDYFVFNINELDKRRYGRAFTREAMGSQTVVLENVWKELKRKQMILTANESFKQAERLVKEGSVHALGVVRRIEAKVASLGNYDDLRFTKDALHKVKKNALVIGTNHYYAKALDRWNNGEFHYDPLRRVQIKLDQIRILKKGVPPDRKDGLKFDAHDLEAIKGPPPLWELREMAHTNPALQGWLNRYHPRQQLCL